VSGPFNESEGATREGGVGKRTREPKTEVERGFNQHFQYFNEKRGKSLRKHLKHGVQTARERQGKETSRGRQGKKSDFGSRWGAIESLYKGNFWGKPGGI